MGSGKMVKSFNECPVHRVLAQAVSKHAESQEQWLEGPSNPPGQRRIPWGPWAKLVDCKLFFVALLLHKLAISILLFLLHGFAVLCMVCPALKLQGREVFLEKRDFVSEALVKGTGDPWPKY